MSPVYATGHAGPVPGPPKERRKALLFCPRCDHESLVEGDWVFVLGDGDVALECPVCRTTLTRRPL